MREMSGDELVQRIIAGETDFDSIRLVEPDLRTSPLYVDAMMVTRKKDAETRYEFMNSDLTGLVAPGMNFHGAHFDEVLLDGVNLEYCDLSYVDFEQSIVRGNLRYCDISCSNFERALIQNTDLTHSILFEAALWNAALFNIAGLRASRQVASIGLNGTIVDSATYRVLQEMHPHGSVLIAQDVSEGEVLPSGVATPSGSYRLHIGLRST